MLHRYSREELLIGEEGLNKLRRARVAVFGIGGVGGYVVEALARSGVGALDLFDGDTVALTNINRQIIALENTVGRPKVEVAQERVLLIDPQCRVEARQLFFSPENAGEVDFSCYDYVADAIDTVTSKIELILRCRQAGVPVISCMGAGNKLDPTAFRVAPIEKTSVCPLARVMRRELKKRGEGGVLHRGVPGPRRRPGGGREGHRGPPHPRQHGLRAQRGGADLGRGDRKGPAGRPVIRLRREKGAHYGTR